MSNGSQLSASIRILDLNLASALQQIYDTKKLPAVVHAVAPRAGGLCEGMFRASGNASSKTIRNLKFSDLSTGFWGREKKFDVQDLFARNTVTFFAREHKITFDLVRQRARRLCRA